MPSITWSDKNIFESRRESLNTNSQCGTQFARNVFIRKKKLLLRPSVKSLSWWSTFCVPWKRTKTKIVCAFNLIFRPFKRDLLTVLLRWTGNVNIRWDHTIGYLLQFASCWSFYKMSRTQKDLFLFFFFLWYLIF